MLEKYIKEIADKLNAGAKVYLCPASFETVLIARTLKAEYGVLPSGFCDNDVKKQGRSLNSMPELTIFSFDDVITDDSAEFLVASPFHSADIIGNLVFERNVPEARVVNFQPIERRKTCARFAQNWIVEDRHFVCCCIEGQKPKFDHKELDPQKGVEYLDNLRNKLIDGDMAIPECCLSCFKYRECYIFKSRRLNSLNFSFRGWCNYKCDYCSANRPDLKGYNDRFSLEQYLVELEKRDMVNGIFSVLFAVGESTLSEKRFPLYDHCADRRYFLDVFTNCSVFDKSLFELAHKSPVIIRKSFDAGTPETYAKIKGVDCYTKMLENVRHYLQAPYLALNPKYLFVPGVNDNETDVMNFVEACARFNVDFVTPVFNLLNFEHCDLTVAKRMFKLLVDELGKSNIFTANVDTLYSQDYHKLYSESF